MSTVFTFIFSLAALCGTVAVDPSWPVPPRTTAVEVAEGVLQRTLGLSATAVKAQFDLSVDNDCSGLQAPCFAISTTSSGRTAIIGSSVSDLSAGIGVYLREHCNMVSTPSKSPSTLILCILTADHRLASGRRLGRDCAPGVAHSPAA